MSKYNTAAAAAARATFTRLNIPLEADYFSISSTQKDELILLADRQKFEVPPSMNGTDRIFLFFKRLQKKARFERKDK